MKLQRLIFAGLDLGVEGFQAIVELTYLLLPKFFLSSDDSNDRLFPVSELLMQGVQRFQDLIPGLKTLPVDGLAVETETGNQLAYECGLLVQQPSLLDNDVVEVRHQQDGPGSRFRFPREVFAGGKQYLRINVRVLPETLAKVAKLLLFGGECRFVHRASPYHTRSTSTTPKLVAETACFGLKFCIAKILEILNWTTEQRQSPRIGSNKGRLYPARRGAGSTVDFVHPASGFHDLDTAGHFSFSFRPRPVKSSYRRRGTESRGFWVVLKDFTTRPLSRTFSECFP